DYSVGQLSLREAIILANVIPGPDTIQFASSLEGQTITLGSALPQITGDLTLTGPGASQLAVSGNSTVEVLSIAAGVTAQLSGLLVENGNATHGGGISNSGTLTLTNAVLSGN